MSMTSLHSAVTEEPSIEAKQYQIQAKVGDAEFFGSGPEESVREDYSKWIDVLGKLGGVLATGNSIPQVVDTQEKDEDPIEKLWDRVYLRKDEAISLNVLPQGKSRNADSIILIVYGYQKLSGLDGVKATVIMEAAKQSGLRIDRINRSLTKDHMQLIITGGSGKGSRYSLNNRGMQYAQCLLEKMFE